jgi:hypothetical protein
MLAKVRNRRGVVASVEPFDGAGEGRLHLVRIEYTDTDGIAEDTILWEREESTDLFEPHSLPRVAAEPRRDPAEFDALVRVTRWGALRPFLNPDCSGKRSEFSASAPFFGVLPRIIASYHYLRQPDILQQFLATCRSDGTGPVRAQLPWDLLVVDKAQFDAVEFRSGQPVGRHAADDQSILRAQTLLDGHSA